MQYSESACRVLALRSLGGVLDKMEVLHVRFHPISADHPDEEGDDHDGETEPVKRFSGVEPFRDEMNDGNDAAALVQNEIAVQDDLCGSS